LHSKGKPTFAASHEAAIILLLAATGQFLGGRSYAKSLLVQIGGASFSPKKTPEITTMPSPEIYESALREFE